MAHHPKSNIFVFFLESKLLSMVRSVSEDTLYDTIEFNEFLQVQEFWDNLSFVICEEDLELLRVLSQTPDIQTLDT